MSSRVLVLVSSLAFVAAAACGEDRTREPLSDELLKNAAYPSEFGGSVQLKDGKFSQRNPVGAGTTTVTLIDARGHGPIDDDKTPDAAIILAASGGGSGTFYSLVAVLNRDGRPEVGGTTALGDRVVVHSVTVADRQIILKMRVHGPRDPLCCPSVETTRTFALKRSLELVSKTD